MDSNPVMLKPDFACFLFFSFFFFFSVCLFSFFFFLPFFLQLLKSPPSQRWFSPSLNHPSAFEMSTSHIHLEFYIILSTILYNKFMHKTGTNLVVELAEIGTRKT